MKIGILITSVSNFGKAGFYNSQEIGLAKALAKRFEMVEVFKLVPRNQNDNNQYVDKYNNVRIHYISARCLGINGLVDLQKIDSSIDILVYFSDTQFAVPLVYKWCKKNNITFFPYIGVIRSHSTNKIIQLITNSLFYRNLNVYKKCVCLVKNTDVMDKLKKSGVKNVTLAPVGIDLDLLNHDFEKASVNELKKKYGYCEEDKIIVFIGRLEAEKRPIELISYFANIYEMYKQYKLLIVGKGSLYHQMKDEIRKKGFLTDVVQYIEKVPNDQIWELYRISDCFVNLNKQEIFGMVLLEAMYYKTKVIAWHAPGPDYIIENGKSGYLVDTESEFLEYLLSKDNVVKENAHERVVNSLTWEMTAKIIKDKIRE